MIPGTTSEDESAFFATFRRVRALTTRSRSSFVESRDFSATIAPVRTSSTNALAAIRSNLAREVVCAGTGSADLVPRTSSGAAAPGLEIAPFAAGFAVIVATAAGDARRRQRAGQPEPWPMTAFDGLPVVPPGRRGRTAAG